eukprot:1180342-Prorocentrum_minimum.AAC.2
MTQVGKVAPPMYRSPICLLDRAVLEFCPPGSGGPKPLDRGEKSIIGTWVALLYPLAAYPINSATGTGPRPTTTEWTCGCFGRTERRAGACPQGVGFTPKGCRALRLTCQAAV